MQEILDDIERWRTAGRRVALARVIGTEGSAPREPGAAMAVSEDGEVAGSVSGGCVETALVADALDVLGSGRAHIATFGYSDDEAFAVGLTCGGTIRVFVEPVGDGGVAPEILEALHGHLAARLPVALATVIEAAADEAAGKGDRAAAAGSTLLVRSGGETTGTFGTRELDDAVRRDVLGHLEAGTTAIRRYGPHGETGRSDLAVFVETFAPPPRMVIFGAVDFTAALAKVAKILGYRVIVCDARPVFATPARFPLADEVVVDWPDRYLTTIGATLGARDAVCVLAHDPKFDVPAVVAALATRVGYIGAMGSRRTAADREQRLREAGVGTEELARVMAPIGLDIGAVTPEETAISICAEIVTRRSLDRTGAPLRTTDGPIHRPNR